MYARLLILLILLIFTGLCQVIFMLESSVWSHFNDVYFISNFQNTKNGENKNALQSKGNRVLVLILLTAVTLTLTLWPSYQNLA